jgi:polysaccharide pyruvyl transferase WcaK-like protein
MEYIYFKDKFELELAKLVVYLAQDQNADLHLLPMHTFHVGGDDRVFNRHLSKLITQHIPAINIPSISIAKSPVSPLEILQSMYHAKFNVCMRFHSVLFADTLGVPYIAIDYTSGGKIKAFLEERGKLNKLISLNDIVEGRWQERLINYI